MRVDLRSRTVRSAMPFGGLVVLLAACCCSVAIAGSAKPHLAGTWVGSYSGAFTGTFTIHWRETGSTLHGSIALSSPHGTYGINGSLNGNAIKFGAVGAGATYTGSISRSGSSMSGRYKSPAGGGSWNAHKKT